MQSESSILIKLYYATISIIPLCRCAVVLNTDPLSLAILSGCWNYPVCAKVQEVFQPFEIIRYGKPMVEKNPSRNQAVAGTQSLCECGLIGIW
jgi:hypothetical protein